MQEFRLPLLARRRSTHLFVLAWALAAVSDLATGPFAVHEVLGHRCGHAHGRGAAADGVLISRGHLARQMARQMARYFEGEAAEEVGSTVPEEDRGVDEKE